MKFKVGDKVCFRDNLTRPGVIREYDAHEGPVRLPYCVDFGTVNGYKKWDWCGEQDLVLYKKAPWFKMELTMHDLYTNKKIPCYMGLSYVNSWKAIYFYHPIPINFIIRYARYIYYFWIRLTRGPEALVIMDRRTFEQVLRTEYERGRKKADEYFENKVEQAVFRKTWR